MQEKELIYLLRQWDLDVEENAPEEDPRRTSDCLRWSEINAIARNTSQTPHPTLLEKWVHIDQCAWCSRAIAGMLSELEKVREEQVAEEKRAIFDSSDPRFRYPDAKVALSSSAAGSAFLERISEWVSAWLRQKTFPVDADTPVYFDSEGTLHIHRAGSNLSGEVRLSLVIDGTSLYIGNVQAEQGSLQLSLPEWNMRNVGLPSELFAIAS